MFIVFEGGDGCGKTTQLKLLADYLKCEGYNVLATKEPGETKAGQLIRKEILLNPDVQKNPYTELFLFEAARSEFVEKVVAPYLAKAYVVISDRHKDSTLAYQGYGRGLDLDEINYMNKLATRGLEPDLTFIIDTNPKTGLEKATTTEFGKKDWFEKENIKFHEKVAQGYREIAKSNPDKYKLIPYIKNGIEEMQQQIRGHVKALLKIE